MRRLDVEIVVHWLIVAALLLVPAPADACSFAAPGWFRIDANLQNVPVEGWVPFRVEISNGSKPVPPPASLVRFVDIEVTTTSGAPVAGRIDWSDDVYAFIWTSDAPLQPSTTYVVTYVLHGAPLQNAMSFTGDFQFTTRSGPLAPLEPATFSSYELTETALPISEVCCRPPPGGCNSAACEPRDCELCWTDAFENTPNLRTSWVADGEENDLIVARVISAMGESSETRTIAGRIDYSFFVHADAPRPEYCVQLELRRLVDGATSLSDPFCVSDEERVPIAPRTPTFEGIDRCETLPEGFDEDGTPRQGGGLDTAEPACGCTSTQEPTRGGWLLLVIIGSIAATALRRTRLNHE